MAPPLDLLSVAVPLRIAGLRAKGGPRADDYAWCRRWAEEMLGPHGDGLLYRVSGAKAREGGYDSAALFNGLSRALAILAFVPGGCTFAGMHFAAVSTSEEVSA